MSYSPNFRGNAANAASRQNQTGYVNGTGSTINIGTPVSTLANGMMSPTDVTSQASVQAFVGLCATTTPSAAKAQVVSAGRLENVSTGFNVGDAIYIGLDGTLINVKPDIGVAGFASGNFLVFVGVVVQNEFNASAQDIQVFLQVFGEL